MHDPLTGLPNRTLLQDRMDQAAQRAHRRPATLLGVIFLDVNDLKRVNDNRGHDAGDQMLQGIAARILQVLRPDDTLARLAGDEFVILCEGLVAESEAEDVATRVHASLETPLLIDGAYLPASVSVGIGYAGDGHGTPGEALTAADSRMYAAKRRRRRDAVSLSEASTPAT